MCFALRLVFDVMIDNMASKPLTLSHHVGDTELWKRFMDDQDIVADCLPPVQSSLNMSSTKASKAPVVLTAADQEQTASIPKPDNVKIP